ncbi:hydroxyethylthiazole kinase [Heliobacterium gestii]|uniref:Hydroxyethylthiazole kinase n=1 Tax=Heliomicrobium gestii TaxID=2699 RepID=A0A845LFH4_HELGE|nr:hydroxyethylthiazole kinase [Heliomicrobium gestii]MBM7868161.1 hydroxyethylthiazole kinase [Heliomicrobium gestii]MZP43359.1 hydroxyethylthiazole kinase [Heliomicrobium gestii]
MRDWVGSCLAEKLAIMRERRPLIHHLTNYVTMNDCANMVLATGASPVMAHAPEEVAEMAAIAGALVLNVGTLTLPWIESMMIAGKAANQASVPVILDPVGAGATGLRTESCRRILEAVKVSVIRANAAEAAVLAGLDGEVKGVDAVSGDACAAARALARRFGVVAAVTGVVDYVSDGRQTMKIENGDAWMARLTGTGCMASSVTGCFCAVEKDPLVAATAALAFYGAAGEIAAGRSSLEEAGPTWPAPRGPMTFKTAFFDAVYRLAGERAAQLARVEAIGMVE